MELPEKLYNHKGQLPVTFATKIARPMTRALLSGEECAQSLKKSVTQRITTAAEPAALRAAPAAVPPSLTSFHLRPSTAESDPVDYRSADASPLTPRDKRNVGSQVDTTSSTLASVFFRSKEVQTDCVMEDANELFSSRAVLSMRGRHFGKRSFALGAQSTALRGDLTDPLEDSAPPASSSSHQDESPSAQPLPSPRRQSVGNPNSEQTLLTTMSATHQQNREAILVADMIARENKLLFTIQKQQTEHAKELAVEKERLALVEAENDRSSTLLRQERLQHESSVADLKVAFEKQKHVIEQLQLDLKASQDELQRQRRINEIQEEARIQSGKDQTRKIVETMEKHLVRKYEDSEQRNAVRVAEEQRRYRERQEELLRTMQISSSGATTSAAAPLSSNPLNTLLNGSALIQSSNSGEEDLLANSESGSFVSNASPRRAVSSLLKASEGLSNDPPREYSPTSTATGATPILKGLSSFKKVAQQAALVKKVSNKFRSSATNAAAAAAKQPVSPPAPVTTPTNNSAGGGAALNATAATIKRKVSIAAAVAQLSPSRREASTTPLQPSTASTSTVSANVATVPAKGPLLRSATVAGGGVGARSDSVVKMMTSSTPPAVVVTAEPPQPKPAGSGLHLMLSRNSVATFPFSGSEGTIPVTNTNSLFPIAVTAPSTPDSSGVSFVGIVDAFDEGQSVPRLSNSQRQSRTQKSISWTAAEDDDSQHRDFSRTSEVYKGIPEVLEDSSSTRQSDEAEPLSPTVQKDVVPRPPPPAPPAPAVSATARNPPPLSPNEIARQRQSVVASSTPTSSKPMGGKRNSLANAEALHIYMETKNLTADAPSSVVKYYSSDAEATDRRDFATRRLETAVAEAEKLTMQFREKTVSDVMQDSEKRVKETVQAMKQFYEAQHAEVVNRAKQREKELSEMFYQKLNSLEKELVAASETIRGLHEKTAQLDMVRQELLVRAEGAERLKESQAKRISSLHEALMRQDDGNVCCVCRDTVLRDEVDRLYHHNAAASSSSKPPLPLAPAPAPSSMLRPVLQVKHVILGERVAGELNGSPQEGRLSKHHRPMRPTSAPSTTTIRKSIGDTPLGKKAGLDDNRTLVGSGAETMFRPLQ